MTRIEIISVLSKYAKIHGITKLAEETGIPRSHLYKILSPKGNPTVDSLVKIAAALDLRVGFILDGLQWK